jgi:hypothetical protein
VEIQLDVMVLRRLSCAGVLAYVAVKMAEGSEATSGVLAGLVKSRSGVMSEGLKELSVEMPGLVAKKKGSTKWLCGEIKAGEGVVVQNLDSERYRLFVDDLFKYWNFLNPNTPFSMGGKDGAQIRLFLEDHPEWVQRDWLVALRNRAVSVTKHGHASASQPLWVWVGRLGDYSAGALNQYNKPVEGSGKNGKAIATEDSNRAARESVLAGRPD